MRSHDKQRISQSNCGIVIYNKGSDIDFMASQLVECYNQATKYEEGYNGISTLFYLVLNYWFVMS